MFPPFSPIFRSLKAMAVPSARSAYYTLFQALHRGDDRVHTRSQHNTRRWPQDDFFDPGRDIRTSILGDWGMMPNPPTSRGLLTPPTPTTPLETTNTVPPTIQTQTSTSTTHAQVPTTTPSAPPNRSTSTSATDVGTTGNASHDNSPIGTSNTQAQLLPNSETLTSLNTPSQQGLGTVPTTVTESIFSMTTQLVTQTNTIKTNHQNNTPVIVGSVIASAALLCVLSWVVVCLRRRSSKKASLVSPFETLSSAQRYTGVGGKLQTERENMRTYQWVDVDAGQNTRFETVIATHGDSAVSGPPPSYQP
ncbi:hypothetical protein E1B28_009525 [Marasmius oreades]|uniref:Uncharacterized protein n=1 Tax=Marasmius oreades TaxID=181124 RepID=A0A9P7RVG8_9AGAR|nr:uncharacterized protein E1B28_009525 [Marasmius oreades]KAG7090405.1 hypothetical protein E1B28_009525 [Marasmius oreades]